MTSLIEGYTPETLPPDVTPWHGGECPVPLDEVLVIYWADGDCEVEEAGLWRWNHLGRIDDEGVADIVGYQRPSYAF